MKKKKWIIIGIVLVVAVALFATFGVSYIKRHFVTNEVSSSAAIVGETIANDHRVLTVYFTRVGNSDFAPDVDAVSGASLMVDGDTLVGNSQLLADMVQNAVGGDVYAIRTEKQYPSGYGSTTSVAKTEFDSGERPVLLGELPNPTQYDTVFLVYPVWWGTIPMAVTSFLEQVDLSGITLYPIATHGGSKESRSVDAIREACNADVQNAICVFDDDVPTARAALGEQIKAALK